MGWVHFFKIYVNDYLTNPVVRSRYHEWIKFFAVPPALLILYFNYWEQVVKGSLERKRAEARERRVAERNRIFEETIIPAPVSAMHQCKWSDKGHH
ncbi:unnamed protein product [Vitrella brassicaformis CCMP3155]|uniref:Uncharacterized protein n=2 Tax=Vitrella brassicaformis TaxID=1169539 RepID=A0A0G4ERT2_VITBC|nr:unnamed protein product [Vitrella brassicaformis CCMP3155]|eukprot:CEM00602.1 unnamed protein product [Vitrella brassicaformis CCMP3155]